MHIYNRYLVVIVIGAVKMLISAFEMIYEPLSDHNNYVNRSFSY